MSFLYVNENGSTISMEAGYFVVKNKDEEKTRIPKETLESIGLFGNIHMTTPCVRECLSRKIPVSYYSTNGYYYGKLEPPRNTNIFRLKKQIHMTENKEFCIGLAKRIIKAKIQNQLVVLKRYNRNKKLYFDNEEYLMKSAKNKIDSCNLIEQILGYEGIASRSYFQALSKIIHSDYEFHGRNRMPPRDPVNAMLSFGYSILFCEIYGHLENYGLTPFGGFMHQDRERHPSLVSDLLEEWRAVIVDATVLSLIQKHEISPCDFEKEDNGGVQLKKNVKKIFLGKLEGKMKSEMNYLSYVPYKTSFRKAVWLQIGELVKVIENEDCNRYEPVTIR